MAKKPENYMKAKFPEPTEFTACWRKRLGCNRQGTMWYRIADSHLSATALSSHPHYWICSCDKHKPYTRLNTEKQPAMADYSKELEMI